MSDLVAANLKAWEEVAHIHARHNQARLVQAFAQPHFMALDEVAISRLRALGVDGASVVQVCCNNGQEVISTQRLGAVRIAGVDGSQGFIDQADELARAAGMDATFVASNIYELGDELGEPFDIAMITIGVLSWMPDLQAFFKIVTRLIRPGGVLFIHEQHPVLEMMEVGGPNDPVAFELSYFSKEPYVDDSGLDYYGGETYDATPNNSFMHKISDVIMAALDAGLVVERFEELPHHISNTWYNVEASGIGLPMSFTLELRKP